MIDRDEQDLLADVGGDAGWRLVEDFSRLRRELPDEYAAGAALLVDRLRAAGLNVQTHRPEIYLGIPRQATLAAAGRTIRAKATALSPTSTVEAPLVFVAARDATARVHTDDPLALFGIDRQTLGRSIAGRIVLTEGLSNPGRSELFQSLGALASITINPGDAVHWGASSVVWGSPGSDDIARLPRIASVAVNRTDGAWLRTVARDGGRATLSTDVLHGWFEQALPVVRIDPGHPEPAADEFVLLHGHLDAWDVGVGDNATGNAVLLEVARALQAHRRRLRRQVVVAWWPGHSAGRYAGSTWFADRFARRLRKGCVAHLNVDSPGCRDATEYRRLRGMAEAHSLVAGAVQDLFGQAVALDHPGRAGDYSFNNLGISGAMLTSSMVPTDERRRRGWYAVGGNGGSPTWHTEDDRIEVADPDVLQADARLYALLALRLAAEATPALDYRRPLAAIRSRVEAVHALGLPVELPPVAAIDELMRAVAACYGGPEQPSPAADRWQGLLRASRAIVRAGHASGDPFGHDPAFFRGTVPMLADAEEALHEPSARVSLQRGANRLADTVEEAAEALGARNHGERVSFDG